MQCIHCSSPAILSITVEGVATDPNTSDTTLGLCKECAESKLICCWNCSQLEYNSDGVFGDFDTGDDEVRDYCMSCWRQLFERCNNCSEVFDLDHSWYNDGYSVWCERCTNDNFSTCEHCSTLIPNEDVAWVNGGNDAYCERCRDRYTHWCESCESYYTGEYCCEERKLSVEFVPYSWKPGKRKFLQLPKEHNIKEFFGWELELLLPDSESRREAVSSLIEQHLTWLVVKEDGSLPDCGVELVSYPMTWGWMRKHKDALTEFLKKLQANRCSVDESCGLHIHMSREGVGRTQLYKMLGFLGNYPKFSLLFSEREPSQMLEYASPLSSTHDRSDMCKTYSNCGIRYRAINLPPDKPTIEFRLFAGTLDPARFFKNLQFCHALKQFSQLHGVKQMHPLAFREWVQLRNIRYKELSEAFEGMDKDAFTDVPDPAARELEV